MSSTDINKKSTESLSSSNITAKMVSFKGKLSGALNYWTTKEKSPPVEKPCKYKFKIVSLYCSLT